jgi:hypothetical protein
MPRIYAKRERIPNASRIGGALSSMTTELPRARDATRLITGETLYIDGGYHIID